ncbi:LysR substrate-binding domain-containing protein [Vogesella sp. LIG4]|uniref:LysR substrate-binding domain-containing protein n=1 Tax=Vogesella sp. LIG4 TaxID=1192162 RepID=UPI00081F89D3|nr:LysR substrate-binding domain-containing protein [Vogesella sp. LIG4]SCK19446.1 LysR family transcriptional regulator, glycine cleavage system transcriptional activator [Vogesella sp. LIG4]
MKLFHTVMNETHHLPALTALRAFVTVVQAGSFTEAARRLCLTQGAISKQIRLLEEHYGTPLLQRQSRQVQPTPSGRVLLPVAQDVVERLREVERKLKTQTDILSLQVYVSFAVRWLMPRLGSFYQQHPLTQLRMESMVYEPAELDPGASQAYILFGRGSWPEMRAELLLPELLSPVCAPSMLQGEHALRSLDALRGHTLFHTTKDYEEWEAWLATQGVHSLAQYKHQVVDLHHLAWTAAASGLGVAIGDMALLQEELQQGRLVRPFEHVLHTGAGYYLVYPDSYAEHPGLQALLSWLREQAAASAAVLA